jgi:diguanylate cyclase (GGDEF)-like protein
MANPNDARDPITGLFNRQYLEDALPREIDRARRCGHSLGLAALALEIKHGDQPAREPSDVLLWEFGYLLQLHLRAEDIACRVHAHEFVVVMPGIDSAVLARRAVELRGALERHYTGYRVEFQGPLVITAVIAAYPRDGLTAPSLIEHLSAVLGRARVTAGL